MYIRIYVYTYIGQARTAGEARPALPAVDIYICICIYICMYVYTYIHTTSSGKSSASAFTSFTSSIGLIYVVSIAYIHIVVAE